MKKLVIAAALLAAFIVGCQTRITAEKFAEKAWPVQQVVAVNGQDQVVTTRYQIASGGWYATARSPLYSTEAIEGLSIGVNTNGTITLTLGGYNRDLSTNSVSLVREMFKGGAEVIQAIAEAYSRIAGAKATAETVNSVAQKVYLAFADAGGDPTKATVTADEANGLVKVSDGKTTTVCTTDGVCRVADGS